MILGSGRIQPETFAEFTPKELKKCKVGCTTVAGCKSYAFFGVIYNNIMVNWYTIFVENFICGFGEE